MLSNVDSIVVEVKLVYGKGLVIMVDDSSFEPPVIVEVELVSAKELVIKDDWRIPIDDA